MDVAVKFINNGAKYSPTGTRNDPRLKAVQNSKSPAKVATTLDAYFLGFGLVVSGQYYSWNLGLEHGFWTYFVAVSIMGFGYICLCCCIAEMSSMLPLPGGAYGLIRVTFGSYMGFIYGCYETLFNILIVSQTFVPLGSILSYLLDTDPAYEPLWWVLLGILSIILLIPGGNYFWKPNTIVGAISLIILCVYILGSIPSMDFDKYVLKEAHDFGDYEDQVKSMEGFISIIPLATWPFIGIESIPLACGEAITPQYSIPRALVYCILTLVALSQVLLFVAASQPPGLEAVSEEDFPLNSGFNRMFGITNKSSIWLSIAGIYISAATAMWAYGRQISALSQSRFLPSFLSKLYGKNQSPYVAILVGSAIAYMMTVLSKYGAADFTYFLIDLVSLFGYSSDIFLCLAFIFFRLKFASLKRQYESPLGYAGAVFGLAIFGFAMFAMVYNGREGFAVPIYFIVIGIASLYYYFVARHTQYFSEAEQKVLLVLYVMKANAARRRLRGESGKVSNGRRLVRQGCSALGIDLSSSSLFGYDVGDNSNSRISNSFYSLTGRRKNSTSSTGSSTIVATPRHRPLISAPPTPAVTEGADDGTNESKNGENNSVNSEQKTVVLDGIVKNEMAETAAVRGKAPNVAPTAKVNETLTKDILENLREFDDPHATMLLENDAEELQEDIACAVSMMKKDTTGSTKVKRPSTKARSFKYAVSNLSAQVYPLSPLVLPKPKSLNPTTLEIETAEVGTPANEDYALPQFEG